jgi:cell division protein ZapA (FtsZ GTPase activity inhibitor)
MSDSNTEFLRLASSGNYVILYGMMSNSDIKDLAPVAIDVSIFNQTYRLRSQTGEEHVRQIANLVDERMRQISAHITTHDVVKIAVLAALNIADEMQSLRNYYEREIAPLLSKLQNNPAVREDRTEAEANKSWFEDFFEAKVETKDRQERLSSQVSAKLQSLREPHSEQMGITSEDEKAE